MMMVTTMMMAMMKMVTTIVSSVTIPRTGGGCSAAFADARGLGVQVPEKGLLTNLRGEMRSCESVV